MSEFIPTFFTFKSPLKGRYRRVIYSGSEYSSTLISTNIFGASREGMKKI
tara:strand:- start:4149 stop:4298 length:150 start_codon:yes stop_codon:yes gene_type:complete